MARPLQMASARAGARVCIVGLVASLSPIANAAQTAQWPARPPLSAACDAWDFHIQDLLDQHRYSQQISDDEFGTALSLFYAAKSSCTLGNEGAAFDMYGRLPLGRPASRELR